MIETLLDDLVRNRRFEKRTDPLYFEGQYILNTIIKMFGPNFSIPLFKSGGLMEQPADLVRLANRLSSILKF